jgi:hypothetical protein
MLVRKLLERVRVITRYYYVIGLLSTSIPTMKGKGDMKSMNEEVSETHELRSLDQFQIGDIINIRGTDYHVMFIGRRPLEKRIRLLYLDNRNENKLTEILEYGEMEFIARKRGI